MSGNKPHTQGWQVDFLSIQIHSHIGDKVPNLSFASSRNRSGEGGGIKSRRKSSLSS